MGTSPERSPRELEDQRSETVSISSLSSGEPVGDTDRPPANPDEEKLLPDADADRTSIVATTPKLFNVDVRYISLAFLTLQNTSLVIQMKYSFVSIGDSGDVYIPSTAVVMSEVCKFVCCLGMIWWTSKDLYTCLHTVKASILSNPRQLATLAVPSILYTLQNNILYYAIQRLDPPTFQITYQLKLVSTALFMRLILAKQLTTRQWAALFLLMIGVASIQIQPSQTAVPVEEFSPSIEVDKMDASPWESTTLSPRSLKFRDGAFSYDFGRPISTGSSVGKQRSRHRCDPSSCTEWRRYYVFDSDAPLLVRAPFEANGDRALLHVHAQPAPAKYARSGYIDTRASSDETTPPSRFPKLDLPKEHLQGLIAVLIACVTSGFGGAYFEAVLKGSLRSIWELNLQLSLLGFLFSISASLAADYSAIKRYGFFVGYDLSTVMIVCNQSLGGLAIAVVIKYADNLLKAFSTSISVILSCILSFFLFNAHIGISFLVGATLVLYSAWLYGKS